MKAYLISTTTAAALAIGFGGGLAAEAAVGRSLPEDVNACLDLAARTSLESVVDSQLCTKADTKLSLTGSNVCKASDHAKRICFTWQRENVDCLLQASGSLMLPWTLTPGPLQ